MDGTAYNQDSDSQQDDLGVLIDQILETLPTELRRAVRLGAIPRWLDQPLLENLSEVPVAIDQLEQTVRRFRFGGKDAQQRLRYHDDVRNYLISQWQQQSREEYLEINGRALAYMTTHSNRDASTEPALYQVEALYHQLIIGQDSGIRYLCLHFEDACEQYRLGLAEALVVCASELSGRLSETNRIWVQYFEARVDLLYQSRDSGAAVFQRIANMTDSRLPDGKILRAVACWSLGVLSVSRQHWSEAIRLYRASLDLLKQAPASLYAARVTTSFGDAYNNLAGYSGGFYTEMGEPRPDNRFLYVLQFLPFLVYDWLVRHVRFLPNWYGINYQHWIIAYLLVEALRWYRRAQQLEGTLDQSEIEMRIAVIEHQLGRWARARHQYTLLLARESIRTSPYRTAQVQTGQGRAFLEEGDLNQADRLLSQALGTFEQFIDNRSIGETAALLGSVYVRRGQLDEAVAMYMRSIRAFDIVRDDVARTQLIGALEALSSRSGISSSFQQQLTQTVAEVPERHYIARFPGSMLQRFRWLALFGALPLTYILMFVVGLALTLALWIIESVIRLPNAPFSLTDVLVLIAFIICPIPMMLWLYYLTYSLTGLALVRVLGRRLIPIEHDQPDQIIVNSNGLIYRGSREKETRTISWSDVAKVAVVDYCQLHNPIRLISRTNIILTTGVSLIIEAITEGYSYLKLDIKRHIKLQKNDAKLWDFNFVVFNLSWLVFVLTISFICGVIFRIPITAKRISTGEVVQLYWTPIVLALTLMLLHLFPMITLLRVVFHQSIIQRTLKTKIPMALAPWTLWVATAISVLLTAIWMIFLSLF